jgi:two-component system cell cycle response regulator CpdR
MIRVLLAEDEQAMREYLARALEKSGYDVVAVDRGTDAIPLLEDESQHFDLLLTDIVMPEMDGIELARQCARLSPKTEVMFITGFSGVALRAGQSMPKAKVLSKPFHLKDLVLEVERMFNKESAQGQI